LNFNQNKFFIKVSIFYLILINFPYIYGYFSRGEAVFTGLIHWVEDGNSYLAWLKQSEDGEILFEDNFTTEKQPKNVFLPFWLFWGKIAKIFKISLISVYHISRILGIIFFLIVFKIFMNYFKMTYFEQKTSYLIFLFSSGFGWYLLKIFPNIIYNRNICPSDLFISTSLPFLAFSVFPLQPYAWALLILIFLYLLKEKIFLAGILSLLLIFVHPYNLVTVYTVGVFLVVYIYLKKKDFSIFRKYILFILLSIPGILVNYYTILTNHVIKYWATHLNRFSPMPISFILGWGFVLILALFEAVNVIKNRESKLYFFIFWIVAGFFLIYSPFKFQQHLSNGLFIPLSILAGIEFSRILKKYFNRKKEFILYIFILITIPSNLSFYILNIKNLREKSLVFYISKDLKEALNFLDKVSNKEDGILTSYIAGNFVPRYTGSKVFAGHFDQTIYCSIKKKLIYKFFLKSTDDNFRFWLVKNYGIKYILIGPGYTGSKFFNPAEKKYLKIIFSNKIAKIYKILI